MSDFKREDGRALDEIRPIKITRNFLKWPEGSVLIEMGETKVIITASVQDNVPRWMEDTGKGWMTANYDMLPRATNSRRRRDRDNNSGVPGRTKEIQRLIGRALRAAFDLDTMGEITIWVDADVIQADGGTRCASITGAFVAVFDAIQSAIDKGWINSYPKYKVIGAVSVGIIDGLLMLDLPYNEDSKAAVDMNVVMDEDGRYIEIQGTAEGKNFTREEMNALLDLAEKGNNQIIDYIRELLELK